MKEDTCGKNHKTCMMDNYCKEKFQLNGLETSHEGM